MEERAVDLRKILSLSIKKHRETLGLSQEKLAESAGISTMMIKDIEGCRTWVSDKTLIKIASVLKTDAYRLLMPETVWQEEIYSTVLADLVNITHKIKEDIDKNLEKTLDLWRIKNQ